LYIFQDKNTSWENDSALFLRFNLRLSFVPLDPWVDKPWVGESWVNDPWVSDPWIVSLDPWVGDPGTAMTFTPPQIHI
jgi:hypothetical protein